MNTCQYCNKNFSSKCNLTKHQKTTKKCLDIQAKIHENIITECKYCKYKSYKTDLEVHEKICKKNHGEVIDKYEAVLLENKTENKINIDIIAELKLEIATLKGKLDSQKEEATDLKKMVMKSRQTNTYVTNQQRIQYSKDNLHSYDELKDNISNIIDSKFNKTTFQTIENVATFITNDILNYNKKEYYHCFDTKGSIFHKKNGDEIDVDEKAEKLLNDILPTIIDKSRKIYIQESDYYNDKNTESDEWKEDEKNLLLLSKNLKNVRNIEKKGSDERNFCIRRIAQCYCITSQQVKSSTLKINNIIELIDEDV